MKVWWAGNSFGIFVWSLLFGRKIYESIFVGLHLVGWRTGKLLSLHLLFIEGYFSYELQINSTLWNHKNFLNSSEKKIYFICRRGRIIEYSFISYVGYINSIYYCLQSTGFNFIFIVIIVWKLSILKLKQF